MTAVNGAYLTHELTVVANMVANDRILILWNADANGAVGNGSPATRMIPLSDMVNSAAQLTVSAVNETAQVQFSNSNTTYTALLTDAYVLVNSNSQNGSVVLPSAAPNGKAYLVKKMVATAEVLVINTDSSNCKIDTANGQQTNTAFGLLSVVMGPDENYWVTSKV